MTFERPTTPNCLQYLRQLWYPHPVLNVIGRDHKQNPCPPRTSLWYMFKHTLLPFLSRERGWPDDILFVLVEEDWRLRPFDNQAMLSAPTAAELLMSRSPPAPDASISVSSSPAQGTVRAVRERVAQRAATAQPRNTGSASSAGPAKGESRPPPRQAAGTDECDRRWFSDGIEVITNTVRSGFKPKESVVETAEELKDIQCRNLFSSSKFTARNTTFRYSANCRCARCWASRPPSAANAVCDAARAASAAATAAAAAAAPAAASDSHTGPRALRHCATPRRTRRHHLLVVHELWAVRQRRSHEEQHRAHVHPRWH